MILGKSGLEPLIAAFRLLENPDDAVALERLRATVATANSALPSLVWARYERAESTAEQASERLNSLRRALNSEPRNSWAWTAFGNLQAEMGRDEIAEEAYRKAINARSWNS